MKPLHIQIAHDTGIRRLTHSILSSVARYPLLIEERSYLTELLTLLCAPSPGQSEPYDGMMQLVGLCVDEMYRWRDDSGANTEPRPYLVRIESEVDEALARYDIHLPTDPYWWDVVDALFDKGAQHQAMLAQRHAAPTLVDAVTAARRPRSARCSKKRRSARQLKPLSMPSSA